MANRFLVRGFNRMLRVALRVFAMNTLYHGKKRYPKSFAGAVPPLSAGRLVDGEILEPRFVADVEVLAAEFGFADHRIVADVLRFGDHV